MNSVTFAMNLCSVSSVFLPTFKNWRSEGLVGGRVPGAGKQPGRQEPNPEAGRSAGSLDSTSALSPQGLRKTDSQREPLRLQVVSWFF